VIPEFAQVGQSQGLIGWYSVISESIQLTDNKVKHWTNLISNGHHFRQSEYQKMPSYNTTEKAMEFTGVQYMVLDRNKPSDSTIIIVSKGSGDAYGDSSTYMNIQSGQANFGSGEQDEAAIGATDAAISTTEKGIYVLKSTASGNELKIGHRRILNRLLSKLRKAADTFYLGKSGRTGGVAFNGQIYEILIYDNVLSDTELDTITDELALRWNIGSVNPKVISVDVSNAGQALGTGARPFRLFKDALDRIFDGGRIKVKKGHYSEKLKINKRTVIEAEDGPVILGIPKTDQ